MMKKLISFFVALAMVLALLPMTAFAKPAEAAAPANEEPIELTKPEPAEPAKADAAEQLNLTLPAVEEATLTDLRAKAPEAGKAAWYINWDFEANPTDSGWRYHDYDSDGHTWEWGEFGRYTSSTHSMKSSSWISGVGALTPDNWLITPAVDITGGDVTATLTYSVASHSASFPESYRIFISTNLDENSGIFNSLTGDLTTPASTVFEERTVDLSAYAGQRVWIAFRHYGCTDKYAMYIDDVSVVVQTNYNPPLTPTPTPTQTPTPTPTQTPTPTPTVTPEPTPVPGSLVYGNYFESLDELAGWQLIDSDGDGNNWTRLESGTYAYEGSGLMGSNSYNSTDGALTPDNWLISSAISLPARNLSLTFYAAGMPSQSYCSEHFAVYAGSTNNVATMTEIMSETVATAAYVRYEVDLSAYANQTIYIAIRHFNCTDQYVLRLDQFEVWGEEALIGISEYNVLGLTIPPIVGETAADALAHSTITAPQGSNYSIINPRWFCDSDAHTMQPDERFEAGKLYSLSVWASPNEGYEFVMPLTCTINGSADLVHFGGLLTNGSGNAYVWTKRMYAADLDAALNAEGGALHFENDATYPWTVLRDGERIYAMSGNAGVHSSTSTISTTVTVNEGETVSFDFKAWGEGSSFDLCIFTIDGEVEFAYGARRNDWEEYVSAPLTAGEHTLVWKYSKDDSVNPTGDYFAVDNVKVNAVQLITIDTVEITGFTVPAWGEHPDFTLSVPEGAPYRITNVFWGRYWPNGGASSMGENDTFDNPILTYSMSVTIEPNEGYVLANPIAATINGGTDLVALTGVESHGNCWVNSIDFTVEEPAPTMIDAIEITGFTVPAWGEHPDYTLSVPAGANYTITEVLWSWETPSLKATGIMPEDETFAAGVTYHMGVRLAPNEGYAFADNVTVTINGQSSYVEHINVYDNGAECWAYTLDFTVEEPLIVIDTVEILDFVIPEWGATPNYDVTVPEGANYSIIYTDWNWEQGLDGDVLAPTDVFDNPEYGYFMFFVIEPAEGYTFAENTVITVNGNASYVGPHSIEADQIVFATIDFFVEQSELVWGDANGDGIVDMTDALLIMRYAMELSTIAPEYLPYCDVNGDGNVDSIDAMIVLRYTMDLIDELR